MTPEQMEARIRQLELIVNQLQQRQAAGSPASAAAAGSDVPPGGTNVLPSQSGGYAAPGQSFPPNPKLSKDYNSPAPLLNKPGAVKFGPGFEIKSDDDEYFLQFHNLTQFDYRGYNPSGENPTHDTFTFPRQWFMFAGRITRPIGYFVSLAHGFDQVNILDVFLDFDYDSRLQLRVGRFKTPFTYEFLVEPIQGLILPERSIFFNNFGQNRDEGVMPYGRLFGGRLDYAAGIFNGARNGFISTADNKSMSAYMNVRLFHTWQGSALENLNIGGSVFAGSAFNAPVVPQPLRTVVATSGNAANGVPFLNFNSNVKQSGQFAFWDLHVAYFYKQLALISEWGSGFQDYALANNLVNKTHLPISSFYVEAGYLLTGETRTSVGVVKPNSNFDLRKGKFGTGAWELTGRFEYLDVGSQIYSAGLADPNYNANRLSLIDVGFNWHMTQYVKFMFMWEHADFNQPVSYNTGKTMINNNAIIARIQLYF